MASEAISIPRMIVCSVNIGAARSIDTKSGSSGIYKLPVDEAVRVTGDGLTGDTIVDVKHHGGSDQAVYVYGAPDYNWWGEQLGETILPGTFGENLTITELQSARLHIGDRLTIGDVVLEVTAPRIPCSTLARRMNDPEFVRKFLDAERPGVYCRVLKEGVVRAGDPALFTPYAGDPIISALELYRDFSGADDARSEESIRRFLAAPIASRARAFLERQLAARHGAS